MKPTRCAIYFALVVLLAMPAAAIQSLHYRLDEYAFNAGGHPGTNGEILRGSAAGPRITLDALGDTIAGSLQSTGGSYSIDSGFVAFFPPPDEVRNLLFADAQTLVWSPEKSVGVYHLYREPISELPGGSYGVCSQSNLPSATATDSDVPPVSGGYMFLVTAENKLGEQGTKGFASGGGERLGDLCP